jgi:hypothetical protein
MFEQTVGRMAGIKAMPYSKLVEQHAFNAFCEADLGRSICFDILCHLFNKGFVFLIRHIPWS